MSLKIGVVKVWPISRDWHLCFISFLSPSLFFFFSLSFSLSHFLSIHLSSRCLLDVALVKFGLVVTGWQGLAPLIYILTFSIFLSFSLFLNLSSPSKSLSLSLDGVLVKFSLVVTGWQGLASLIFILTLTFSLFLSLSLLISSLPPKVSPCL